MSVKMSGYKITIEDENNLITTRRVGADLVNFSLRDKEELNRNIPFSKFRNIDFSGITQSSSTKKFGYFRQHRCPSLI